MREVITANYPPVVEELEKAGVKVLTVEKSPFISDSLATHSDMLAFVIDKVIVLDQTQKALFDYFSGSGRICFYNKRHVCSGYPDDVFLNCAVVGKNLICNKATASNTILSLAVIGNYNIIDVNQGYAKCSTCVVSDNAVITDDVSIHRACGLNKIDSLLVSKGSVSLEGYNYGFIGGCSGLIEEGLLAFCGDIRTHSDFELIRDFLAKHKVKYISLFDGKLIDIGGIISV